jgi:hypothetical protein
MNRLPLFTTVACLLARSIVVAQPALTIYNQNFAVVRDTVPLDLKSGENQVRFAGATAFVEPASVILRDPSGKTPLLILEQNYRGDPVSQEMLLQLNEGKTIQFEVVSQDNGKTKRELISGKIIRSGSGPAVPYGFGGAMAPQPIIEVNGKLQFTLPGLPIFPALGDDTILKPTLQWVIAAERSAKLDAELSYVTGGFTWESDYNLVMPERGDTLDLVGWITMDNQSGKSFERARIKLMAGDVNKIQNVGGFRRQVFSGGGGGGGGPPPPVTEKTFDEYHLYTLERPTTLLDQEKKQVEFARAAGVKSTTLYIYDGAILDPDWYPYNVRTQPEYGTACNKKVWVFREFTNSSANQLGLPLPKGRVRFYRRNTDGQMEFTGENTIEHTPRDEVVRLNTGNAFDLVGERKRTDLKMDLSPSFPYAPPPPAVLTDPTTGLPIAPSPSPTTNSTTETVTNSGPWIDESFEITLRNHKKEPVEIRIVEHLYRWANWEVTKKSDPFVKTEAQTIEFRLPLKADEQRTVSYTVHYWRW